jgi:outer membrane protein assembly factor BamB
MNGREQPVSCASRRTTVRFPQTVVSISVLVAAAGHAFAADSADAILEKSGVKGGLVVHLGCGDGSLTAALLTSDSYLVHGLDTDDRAVLESREAMQNAVRYGKVSVDLWDGKRLPYADGVVNLIVDDRTNGNALRSEFERVLAPRGVVMVRGDAPGQWRKEFVQPVPSGIDEWTHYRHDPSNNNVAQDVVVDSPRSIKWVAGPEMLRHHDHLPSLSAMVTSAGRVFYVFDEGPAASIMFPPDWHLIARDAFSGVLLWKKKIDQWHPHLWPLKSMPATLPRRLVSVGESVFVTLGIDAPVSQLNAADGSEIRVFAGSERCEEILVKGETMLALRLTGKGPLDDTDREQSSYLDGRVTKFPLAAKLAAGIMSPQWLHADRRLIAYDVNTGKEQWRYDGKFAPLSLATDGRQVYFHNGKTVVALNAETGAKAWQSEEVPVWQEYFAWYGASLVVYDDVVLFSGGENMTWYSAGTPKGANDTMTAFSAVDGKKLWSAAHPPSGYRSPEDLMVAQGLVWASDCTHRSSSVIQGLDLHTGKVVREVAANYGHGFHHRCYPAKATERYLLLSKVGINLISFDGDKVDNNHWVRGACGYGFMPGNGLIYATPDPCNCFPESKLNGFAALAPEATTAREQKWAALAKGPAFEAFQGATPAPARAEDWPTYRHDASRGGATNVPTPADWNLAWKAEVGGRISAPVIAGGRVYVASIDSHRVVALNADSGEIIWTKTVGGRVDSPPTIITTNNAGKSEDLCLFGCADGSVYCLRATDGELVWRRRLAPADERIVGKEGIESVWPVHGSVLFHKGLVYAVAGRATFVDSGLYLFGLDPITGDVKTRQNRNLDNQRIAGMNADPAKPDVLSAIGENLFMRSMAFDLEGAPAQAAGKHIFASNGFLNDSWFHRAFWVYGRSFAGGCGGFGKTGQANHSGRIMVADNTHLFGFGRTKYGWGSAFEYKLYSAPLAAAETDTAAKGSNDKRRRGKNKKRSNKTTVWSVDSPLLVRGMVKAGDTILIAGPKRLYNELETIQSLHDPAVQAQVEVQLQAWRSSAELVSVSAADGGEKNRIALETMPVWDGMAVARGAIFISGKDGLIRCLK